MSSEAEDSGEYQNAAVELIAGRQKLRLEMSVSRAPTHPMDLLPLYRSIAEALVNAAVESVESAGAKISCKAHCGACCRQVVPVSEMEARRLRDVVDEMPEPRRSEIRGRFANARQKLEELGMLERLQDPDLAPNAELVPFIREYFRLGIACPFLEDESCSIYSERPVSCREYLVISPAEHCSDSASGLVRRVKVRGEVSEALGKMGKARASHARKWIALILACEWADTHPDDATPRPGTELVAEFFNHLQCDASPA